MTVRTDLSGRSATRAATRVLVTSTIAFTLLFAAWLAFGILGPPIRAEFRLDDVRLFWLGALAVLTGSVLRLPAGMLADRLGGRAVMLGLLLIGAVASALLATAHSYAGLVGCALAIGIGGNSFTSGIAWNAAWFPRERQGFALGVYGAGNVGASLTKLTGPALIALVPAAGLAHGLMPGGWRAVPALLAIALALMAVVVWGVAPADRTPSRGRPLGAMLAPLARVRVWRFGLYYLLVFGAYVALSLVLPAYFVDTYRLTLARAGLLTALFIFPASLLRPLGGWLADRYGARPITYAVFALMIGALIPLALPALGLGARLGLAPTVLLLVVLGVAMGIGKASVYKYVAEYYPHDVGAVGGLVGALGALGGFVLPLVFGYLKRWTSEPATMFAALLVVTAVTFAWMHAVVVGLRRRETADAVPAADPSSASAVGAG